MKTLLQLKVFLCCLGFVLITSACKKEMPVADFTTTISGKTVQFTNTSTNAKTYYWQFGDGEVSDEQSPSHTYAKSGTYTVILRVLNLDASLEASFKSSVIVIP